MPHTRSKKKKLAAQLAASNAEQGQGKTHTKRTHIQDQDGWTHVVDVGKGRKAPRDARGIITGEKFSIGDFDINGISYVNRTLEDLERDMRYYMGKWEESGAGLLRSRLSSEVNVEGKEEGKEDGEIKEEKEGEREVKPKSKLRKKISNIVCLGLGSLQSARREGRRASFMQLAALRTLISILEQQEEEPLEVIFQDPVFTELDREFLSSLSSFSINATTNTNTSTTSTTNTSTTPVPKSKFKVLTSPQAFTHINDQTAVYAIHCYASIYASVFETARPAMLVGTDFEMFGWGVNAHVHTSETPGKGGSGKEEEENENAEGDEEEKEEDIGSKLREMIKSSGYEKTSWPAAGKWEFSDTVLYWRCKDPAILHGAGEGEGKDITQKPGNGR